MSNPPTPHPQPQPPYPSSTYLRHQPSSNHICVTQSRASPCFKVLFCNLFTSVQTHFQHDIKCIWKSFGTDNAEAVDAELFAASLSNLLFFFYITNTFINNLQLYNFKITFKSFSVVLLQPLLCGDM